MSAQTVAPGRALDWVVEGSKALLVNPLLYAGMGLLVIVLNFIPLVNMIVGLAMPIFQAGVIYALHEQAQGREVKFEHLFRGFTTEGKLVPLILLCVPAIAAGVAIVAVLFIFMGGAIMGLLATSDGGNSISTGGSVLAGGSALIGILLTFIIAALVGMAMFFAVPRVMLDNIDPIEALKESFVASLQNWLALLLLVALGFGIVIVCLIPIIGWLLLLVLFIFGVCLGASIQYQAYRDVFAD